MLKVVVPNTLGRYETMENILEDNGCELVRLPVFSAAQPLTWTTELIERYFADADAFVGTFAGARITREVLEGGPKLRVGASTIIGTETIDVEAATDLGIVIGYGALPENYLGVSEAAVMLIAALLKRLPAKWDETKDGGWRVDNAGRMVMSSTIGLIGLGNVGRGTARRLQGWDCRILASDPYVDPVVAAELGVELVDLETLLRSSDIVSLGVILTEETRRLIGERELALMKQGSYLVNAARGACVDESALIRALESGHLAGAAVDAWEEEPASADNPLRRMPNVITTGHNVAHSEELYARIPVVAAESILRGLRGEEPVHVRNPEVLPRWRERLARLGVVASAR
jgi:phosphoglycerate dehydrogenase-like enzyme